MKKHHANGAIYVLIVLAVILSCSTSEKLILKVNEAKPSVNATTSPQLGSEDTLTFETTKLTFEGSISEVLYNQGSGSILVKYGDNIASNILHYNVDNREVNWALVGNPDLDLLTEDYAFLRKGAQVKLYDARTGMYIRDIEPGIYVLTGPHDETGPYDEKGLYLYDKNYYRIDIRTGDKVWNRVGGVPIGFREEYLEADGWMYLISDGLHAFNIQDGEGWTQKVSISRKGTGAAIAQNVIQGFFTVLSGTSYPTAKAKLTHNINSQPLIVNDNVFFAARDQIYAFDRETGQRRWQSDLGKERGRMWLTRLPVGHIALHTFGWTYVDFSLEMSSAPYIRIFSPATGENIAEFEFNDTEIIQSLFPLGENIFCLTPSRFLKMNSMLEVIGIFDSSDYGQFISILGSYDERVLLRTSLGILFLSAETLEFVSFNKITSKHGLKLLLSNDQDLYDLHIFSLSEQKFSSINSELKWVLGPNGLNGYDLFDNVKLKANIPTANEDSIVEDNTLISYEGNVVTIVRFDRD